MGRIRNVDDGFVGVHRGVQARRLLSVACKKNVTYVERGR